MSGNMRRFGRRALGGGVACAGMGVGLLAGTAAAVTVNNPGFEVGVATPSTPIGTAWSYDTHSFVAAENGITPAAGNRMLKFIDTSWGGPGGVVCDVFQALDLTSPADQAIITGGGASLNVGAVFNRVLDTPAPNITDNRFRIGLYACTSFTNAQSLINTGNNYVDLFSDSNLATWEPISNTLPLPTSTQWVVIHLAAVENVLDDPTSPEFRGHYADEVRATLTPAPASLALLGAGGVLAGRRRR